MREWAFPCLGTILYSGKYPPLQGKVNAENVLPHLRILKSSANASKFRYLWFTSKFRLG